MAESHTKLRIMNCLPQTVGGFFMNLVANNQHVSPQDWLINAKQHNKCMPKNLHLFCGDRHLDLLVDPLTRKAGGDVTHFYNPYR